MRHLKNTAFKKYGIFALLGSNAAGPLVRSRFDGAGV
jgi:hypothetical protein